MLSEHADCPPLLYQSVLHLYLPYSAKEIHYDVDKLKVNTNVHVYGSGIP